MNSKKHKLTREPHQKKASSKGRKSMRGQAENRYGEPKERATHSLTPKAIEYLKNYARKLGIPESDVLERLLRMESILEMLVAAIAKEGKEDSDGL